MTTPWLAVSSLIVLHVPLGPAARACTLWVEPPLQGESDAAYREHAASLAQQRQAQWLKDRQSEGLRQAKVIFIARDTDWWPSPKRTSQKLRYRNGRPLPPAPIPPTPKIAFSAPSYFKPLDWFRGPKSTALFKVERHLTTCGSQSLGDTTSSQNGSLFVLFATGWPATKGSLLDAIAVDRINDPALMEFVSRYRGKSPVSISG